MRKIMTVEGVTILFPDKEDNPNVTVIDLEGDKKTIIVETTRSRRIALSHLNLATLLNALARNRQTLVSEGS